MRCQNCGNNEANVKYTQIINGVRKEMHLCDECARKLGIVDMVMPKMNISSMINDIFDDFNDMTHFMPSFMPERHLLYDTILNPYEEIEQENAADKELDLMIKNMQKNKKETKKDVKQSKESKIKELQARLEQEIKEERYEDAAKTRDEIKKIK